MGVAVRSTNDIYSLTEPVCTAHNLEAADYIEVTFGNYCIFV